MTKRIAGLVLLMITISVGCAGMTATPQATQKPVAAEQLQVEGKAAYYGRELIGLADTALTQTETLTDERLRLATTDDQREAIKAEARAVITVIRQVGTYSKQLATALKAVDQARTAVERKQYMDAVHQVIVQINTILAAGNTSGDSGTRAAVGRMFSGLSKVLIQLALTVPRAG